MTRKYADPNTFHVTAFKDSDGDHYVAQSGNAFFHFTERPGGPTAIEKAQGGKGMTRSATIYRDGDSVTYAVDTGVPPSSGAMSRVMSSLPADMRQKRVIIKKQDVQKF